MSEDLRRLKIETEKLLAELDQWEVVDSVTQAIHGVQKVLAELSLKEAVEVSLFFDGGPFSNQVGRVKLPAGMFSLAEPPASLELSGVSYRLVPGPVFQVICKQVEAGSREVSDSYCLKALYIG